MANEPKIWSDKCYVTISRLTTGATTSTNLEYGNKTGDITIGGGEKGFDVINVNTGDIEKLNRLEPFEISFENAIPLYASNFRALKEGGTTASSGLIEVTSGTETDKFRVALLWTDESGITSGTQNIASGSYARRAVIRDARLTNLEENWEAGGVLTGNITFKVMGVDEDGDGSALWQSIDGSDTMGALAEYTGGNFGN